MSLRKVAGLLGAFTLSLGLLGGGVSAAFTDQVTAVQNVSVGTFSCQITNATAGTIAPDGKSLDYVVPGEIQAYTPSSAPFSFTVANTGAIPVSLSVTSWGLEAPFSSILAVPTAPVTVAAGATQVYNAGIQWAELGMSDLGKTASIHYVVNCGEARFASTPAISFISGPNYAADGYLHDWISGVGFAPGPLAVTVTYQFGSPVVIQLGDRGLNPTSTAAGTWAVDFNETCVDGAGVAQTTDVAVAVTATDGTKSATGTGTIPCSGAVQPTQFSVVADANSPTGETATFVYTNPNATRVQLGGDLTMLDKALGQGSARFQPEAFHPGMYHCGGVEFLRDMTKDVHGIWHVSIPMTAGGLSYWFRVWDPSQGWSNKRIWDPASVAVNAPRPPLDPANPVTSSPYRVKNNDVLGAVYVPYDAAKQNDAELLGRGTYELPVTNPAQKGSVQWFQYTTILGGVGYNIGVYLPAGYDPLRAEPYKIIYLAHGIYGDETDWTIPGNGPNIFDNLIAKGELESTVFVTFGNQFVGSGNLPSYNQQNAADNLVTVIMPLVQSRYNVRTDRAGRAYGGFSMGGMTGGNVISTYQTTFGYYAFFSGNPSITTANYNSIAAANGANLLVYAGNGFFEGSLAATNTIRDNFTSRGVRAYTNQVYGAHDMMTAGMHLTFFAQNYLWK